VGVIRSVPGVWRHTPGHPTMSITTHEPTSACAVCKGKCCKHYPGVVFPSDCGPNVEARLRGMLKSGRYVLDYWDGTFEPGDPEDFTAYFVRPKTAAEVQRYPDRIVLESWGGQCTFLQPDGCELEFKDRPLNCRMLKPREHRGEECKLPAGSPKEDAIRAWKPYNAIIKTIIKEHDGKYD